MGRPSKYTDKTAKQAYKLCLLGAKDEELASFFEVDVSTIDAWKKQHQEFSRALKAGKDDADATVAKRLFKRATGYSHPEDKIFNDSGKPLIVPTIKHYPPDTTAAIFWLKNRQRDKWRDRHDHEHTGKGGGAIKTETKLDLSGLTIDQLESLHRIATATAVDKGGAGQS